MILDWNEVWKAKKNLHLQSLASHTGEDFWSDPGNVRRLYIDDLGQADTYSRDQIGGMEIKPGMTVLDIGAGPGNLAIPLAKMGCRVTAVEPSRAMVAAFEERQAREHVAGITIIGKRWEDIQPGDLRDAPFDVVLASYSLAMADIRQAVTRMNEVSGGTVYIFWFMKPKPSSLLLEELWPKIYTRQYHHEPMADCLYMVLIQMGIYPGIECIRPRPAHRYRNIGDAVADFYHRMHCTTPAQETIIRLHLRNRLCMEGKGFQLMGSSPHAKIWWRKKQDAPLPG